MDQSAEVALIEHEVKPKYVRSKSITFNLEPFDAKSQYKSELGRQGHVPQKIQKTILKSNGPKSSLSRGRSEVESSPRSTSAWNPESTI